MTDKASTGAGKAEADKPAPISLVEFLESVPPSAERTIGDMSRMERHASGPLIGYYMNTPEIHIHCPSPQCNGFRFFRFFGDNNTNARVPLGTAANTRNVFLRYECSNCKSSQKFFALRVFNPADEDVPCAAVKYGEIPLFGPPTPQRLLKLLENEREPFLLGRRCENQGLGIGAFAYYRRVVERQRNRFLDEIAKVAKKLGAPNQTLELFEQAKAEQQFAKSISLVKDAIPQSLLIGGHHNPLTLLHSALSAGLHERSDDVSDEVSDEACLELAQSIRLVLAEFAERLSAALKNDAELNAAVNKLMKISQQKP